MKSVKNLIFSLGFIVILIILGSSWYTHKRHVLQNNLDSCRLPLQNIVAKTQGISLDGQSLVFYDVRHRDWPDFFVRRVQIQNSPGNFVVQLKGIRANLLDHFKRQPSGQFQYDLQNYEPQKNLLSKALLSLAVLGYDKVYLDIAASVTQTAPNQISLELKVYEQGNLKLHLNGKTSAANDTDHVVLAVENKDVSYHILYIDPKWKELFDIYTLSKDLPFLTEYVPYTIHLSEDRK